MTMTINKVSTNTLINEKTISTTSTANMSIN